MLHYYCGIVNGPVELYTAGSIRNVVIVMYFVPHAVW